MHIEELLLSLLMGAILDICCYHYCLEEVDTYFLLTYYTDNRNLWRRNRTISPYFHSGIGSKL